MEAVIAAINMRLSLKLVPIFHKFSKWEGLTALSLPANLILAAFLGVLDLEILIRTSSIREVKGHNSLSAGQRNMFVFSNFIINGRC